MGNRAEGHLFVVRADLTALECDAVLVPTDDDFCIEAPWAELVGTEGATRLDVGPWGGDELVRRLGRARKTPIVFLGRVATVEGTESSIRRAADVATAYIEAAADELSSKERPAHRARRIALPLIGTGAAGLAEHPGELLEPLLEALRDTAAGIGIDVVLAVVDDLAWAAIQQVRRRHASWQALDANQERIAIELAERARADRLVLFLGAGVSRDAGLPDWDSLLESVATRLRLSTAEIESLSVFDARDRARLLELRAGSRKRFVRLLRNALRQKRFGLTHALLASLGVESAVTTNFDRLYERACTLPGNADSAPRVLPYEIADDNRPWVLKLHGDIGRPDVVITRSDYLGLARERGALFGIVQAMLVTRHLLFVGYSMSDEDFHALVEEINAAVKPEALPHLGTALVLDDPSWGQLWSGSIDVEPIDRSADLGANARTLQIVLDMVNALAADSSPHLLESRYWALLDDAEVAVVKQLSAAVAGAAALPPKSHVRETVLRVLGEPSRARKQPSTPLHDPSIEVEPGGSDHQVGSRAG